MYISNLNRKIYIRPLAIIAALLINFSVTGCGKLNGQFAFKSFFDDTYRRITNVPEFDSSKKVNWVYMFSEVNSKHNICIVIMKKELVWVDIDTQIEKINMSKKIIYGEIKNFEEGTYAIILSEEDNIIDRQEFIIYKENKDWGNQ